MADEKKEVRLTVKLDEDTRDKFEQIAKDYNLNKNDIARSLIENYVRGHEARNRR